MRDSYVMHDQNTFATSVNLQSVFLRFGVLGPISYYCFRRILEIVYKFNSNILSYRKENSEEPLIFNKLT